MTRDAVFLHHILDAIARIEDYSAVSQEEFLSNLMRQDAVIRQLEIVGEATKRLSTGLRSKYPMVDWRQATGTRDRLAHGYMEVSLEIVWAVTQRSIPEFKRNIEAILAENPDI